MGSTLSQPASIRGYLKPNTGGKTQRGGVQWRRSAGGAEERRGSRLRRHGKALSSFQEDSSLGMSDSTRTSSSGVAAAAAVAEEGGDPHLPPLAAAAVAARGGSLHPADASDREVDTLGIGNNSTRLYGQMRFGEGSDENQNLGPQSTIVRTASGRPRHTCMRERSLARLVEVPVPTIQGSL